MFSAVPVKLQNQNPASVFLSSAMEGETKTFRFIDMETLKLLNQEYNSVGPRHTVLHLNTAHIGLAQQSTVVAQSSKFHIGIP